jgi:DNA-binding NarL/FixJ family response regulator
VVDQPEAPITLLLADDHQVTREGIRAVLVADPTLRVVGVATSAIEAVAMVRDLAPDVLLLDLQLPDESGIAVLRRLRAEALPTRVAILSAHTGDANVAEAIKAGAVGYLRKDIAATALLSAVRAIAKGRPVFTPDIASRLRERAGLLANLRASALTPREEEVLRLFAAGLGYRTIAQRLSVSVATVKFHAAHLYQKLQASTRVEALNHAREWGLLG